MKSARPMMIAVRGYAEPHRDFVPHSRKRKRLRKPSDATVVFDTETSTDHAQRLRFGTYQVRIGQTLEEKGIFYEPDSMDAEELGTLQSYAREHELVLCTREKFVRDVLYYYGYDRGGLIVGFNLPFDLSRLATSICTSHGRDMRGGFSLELLPEKWRPHILVRHLNSKTAFIRFAAHSGPADGRSRRKKDVKTEARRGCFQDVKTLGAALLGGSHGLASLAKLLQTAHQKIETSEHGSKLTAEYVGYAVNDTDVTWDCYVKLHQQYEMHALTETPPHLIYSEASLGKGYLRQMGIESWRQLQTDFSAELLGIIMSTYYGGRAEIRIRRQVARVLYCDFRSMYPSVCTLMGLWRLVISTGIREQDCTEEARTLLGRVSLRHIQRPSFWRKLNVLVQVEPQDDIFPVRARYGGYGSSRTIGLNHLTTPLGLWYTLADCIASTLLSGRPPKVVRAIRFAPLKRQRGLKPIVVGGNVDFTIHPSTDDFYKRVIELRGSIQSEEKRAKAAGEHDKAELLRSYSQMLKLLANSTSYGIFAEMNVQSHDRPRDVRCYGLENGSFDTASRSIEEPGSHFHPLLATLITGAARLMLAVAERVALDNGIGWAFCDTDSLALARPEGMDDSEFLKRATAVTKWFDPLNPYEDRKPLFKIEEQNFRLGGGDANATHDPLYTIAISAKRYVLFNLGNGNVPVIRKALAHGLGHWLPPYKDAEAPASIPRPAFDLKESHLDRWHYDLWYRIVSATLEGHPEQVNLSDLPGLDRPARSRYSASTSALLHWFDRFNANEDTSKQVRAFNFLLAYQVSKPALLAAIARGEISRDDFDNDLPAVVAPYNDDPDDAVEHCFDRRTGQAVPRSVLATYREAIASYHLHSESKFANGDFANSGLTMRRHIQAVAVEYIGKEANRWQEQFFLGEITDAQIEYGISAANYGRVLKLLARAAKTFDQSALAEAAAISRQHLAEILKRNATPRADTLTALVGAVGRLDEGELEKKRRAARELKKLRVGLGKVGLTKTARNLGCDPSNLRKVLEGRRSASRNLRKRLGVH